HNLHDRPFHLEYMHMDALLSQAVGIPQGSVLSGLLCNYFFGHIEKRLLGDVLDGGSPFPDPEGDCTLLRQVDDFLLVSDDSVRYSCCIVRFRAGRPGWSATVQPRSTLVNFEMVLESSK
ncbi:unnamed protein product, partial [Ectocarpus sp. 8 AP-2014]